MNDIKAVWLREEISIADDLLSYVPKLTEEFLAYHTDFIEGEFAKGVDVNLPTFDTPNQLTATPAAWKLSPLKYALPLQGIEHNFFRDKDTIENFPTACALVEKYNDDCICASYSILDKNSVIARHMGMENCLNTHIRIHVPLIVPEGDIFFELEGSEIDWSDLWGFDDTLIHSAHNLTDKRRLVFLIDIRRSLLGIPEGEPYDHERMLSVPPFVRGAKPKILHQHQRG